MRAYKVYAIKQGTVIDHIPDGKGLPLIELLQLHAGNHIVTMGSHFQSKRMGKKDVVKIEHKELTPEEVNQVCLLAPTASINIIRNFKIIKKFTIETPEIFEGIIACPNPRCITNHETCVTKFYPKKDKKNLKVRCHYCEKIYPHQEILPYHA